MIKYSLKVSTAIIGSIFLSLVRTRPLTDIQVITKPTQRRVMAFTVSRRGERRADRAQVDPTPLAPAVMAPASLAICTSMPERT